MFTPCKTRNPEVIFVLAAKKSGFAATKENFTRNFQEYDLEKQSKVLSYLRKVVDGGVLLTKEAYERLTA